MIIIVSPDQVLNELVLKQILQLFPWILVFFFFFFNYDYHLNESDQIRRHDLKKILMYDNYISIY